MKVYGLAVGQQARTKCVVFVKFFRSVIWGHRNAKKWGLSKKLMLMGFAIGVLIPALGVFAYYQNLKVAALRDQISDIKLVKTKELGELVFKFRDIRIQVRTVPVRGMSSEKIDVYLENTKKAVAVFLEAKKSYELKIENEEERKLFNAFDSSSNDFLEFGGTLISLASAHDQTKIDEVATLVRDVCPVKAEKVESAVTALVNQQSLEATALVNAAHKANSETNLAITFGSILGFILALCLGYIVARSISRELQTLADQLSNSSEEVTGAAEQVSAMSGEAAKEITDLLTSSVEMVQKIVTTSKERVETQAHESKVRVENGIKIGMRCGESLVEILEGARKVDVMVTDIATASKEQALGVSEVSKAMNQMDQVTQANATVSSSSAESAVQLSEQAKQMKSLVDRLNITINGAKLSSKGSAPAITSDYQMSADDDTNRQAA